MKSFIDSIQVVGFAVLVFILNVLFNVGLAVCSIGLWGRLTLVPKWLALWPWFSLRLADWENNEITKRGLFRCYDGVSHCFAISTRVCSNVLDGYGRMDYRSNFRRYVKGVLAHGD